MLRWLPAPILALAACNGLIPEAPPDTFVRDTAVLLDVPEDVTIDVPDIGVTACERDEDCAPYATCCLDVVCQEGACMPAYVSHCCTVEGPCAVSTALRTAVCEETCVPWGCVESLALGAARCDETLWQAELTAEGVAALTVSDPIADSIGWHLDRRRTFAGGASWRFSDAWCPTYETSVDPATCEALGGSGQVEGAFETPTIDVPSDAPSLVELWLYADLPASDGLSTPLDGLEMQVLTPTTAPVTLWSTRSSPVPARAWTPVLIDLSLFHGKTVSLRFEFDSLDGRDNRYEGVAIGRLRVRTACAADRDATDRSACEVAWPTGVSGVRDTVVVFGPPRLPDPGAACVTCGVAESCPRADTCDVAACTDGRCAVTREITEACCTPDARWPGDGSFEEPLIAPEPPSDDGWTVLGPWSVSALRSVAGESALHFGEPDGSGLAPPGEAAEGLALSPLVRVPEDLARWRFALYLATEWDASPDDGPIDNPSGVDLLEAVVLPAGPPLQPLVVWSSRAIGGTTRGAWQDVTIDLSRFAGADVHLGWRFRTGDADANDGEGVYVDRAVVFRACPGCDDGAAPRCDQLEPEPE